MIKTIKASPKNYGGKRKYTDIDYIVIHYTGNDNDTAENNAKYFKNNIVKASAHFFVDRKGTIIKSVPVNCVAWSVGGKKYTDCTKTGGGRYYGKCTNSNSVSIELCDIKSKSPSEAQIKSVKQLIKKIEKICPNVCTAGQIVRHFDVNGKHCPATMMDNHTWNTFKAQVIPI